MTSRTVTAGTRFGGRPAGEGADAAARPSRESAGGRWSAPAAAVLATALLGASAVAQAPTQTVRPTDRPAGAEGTDPVFRSGVTLVTMIVVPRDRNRRFVDDLTAGDFVVVDEGEVREVASLVRVQGGRVSGQLAPGLRSPRGGVLPPPPNPVGDLTGRLFIILVDELHIAAGMTARARAAFAGMAEHLVQEGDQFAVVSTGPSAISVGVTTDRGLLRATAERITGDGFDPDDLIRNFAPVPGYTPELLARAGVAFTTMRNVVESLEQVQHLRKVVVYFSGGYDFNPFLAERRGYHTEAGTRPGAVNEGIARLLRQDSPLLDPDGLEGDGELARRIDELAEAANRANAPFYTVDPAGLLAGPGAADFLLRSRGSFDEWNFKTRNSLRSIAEQTGGRAVVNRNDFDDVFREIDAETRDYYVLGFALTDPDPTLRTRRLIVRVRGRAGVDVQHRTHYTYGGATRNRPALR